MHFWEHFFAVILHFFITFFVGYNIQTNQLTQHGALCLSYKVDYFVHLHTNLYFNDSMIH